MIHQVMLMLRLWNLTRLTKLIKLLTRPPLPTYNVTQIKTFGLKIVDDSLLKNEKLRG